MHPQSSRTGQLCSPRIVKLEAVLTMIFLPNRVYILASRIRSIGMLCYGE